MRRFSAFLVLLVLSLSSPIHSNADEELLPQGEFWAWVANPYQAEIEVVLSKVEEIRATLLSHSFASDTIRESGLKDAFGMLAYALHLRPNHPALQLEYAKIAHELGKPDVTKEVLVRYLSNTVTEEISPLAYATLGRVEAEAGRWSEAALQLERVLSHKDGFVASDAYVATVHCLASAYVQMGRMARAIELLEEAINRQLYLSLEDQLFLQFALAMAYDRDEQLTRAHDVLQRLVRSTSNQLITFLASPNQRAKGFFPIFDQHYYMALLYEVSGHYIEARAEWSAYARLGDRVAYRRRALDHITRIDELLMARPRPDRRHP